MIRDQFSPFDWACVPPRKYVPCVCLCVLAICCSLSISVRPNANQQPSNPPRNSIGSIDNLFSYNMPAKVFARSVARSLARYRLRRIRVRQLQSAHAHTGNRTTRDTRHRTTSAPSPSTQPVQPYCVALRRVAASHLYSYHVAQPSSIQSHRKQTIKHSSILFV